MTGVVRGEDTETHVGRKVICRWRQKVKQLQAKEGQGTLGTHHQPCGHLGFRHLTSRTLRAHFCCLKPTKWCCHSPRKRMYPILDLSLLTCGSVWKPSSLPPCSTPYRNAPAMVNPLETHHALSLTHISFWRAGTSSCPKNQALCGMEEANHKGLLTACMPSFVMANTHLWLALIQISPEWNNGFFSFLPT